MLDIGERVSVLHRSPGGSAAGREPPPISPISPDLASDLRSARRQPQQQGGSQEMSITVSELATNAIQHGSTGLYRRSVPEPGSGYARRPDDNGAPSDHDLLRMQVEGDPDAFGALFRRHRDQLRAVAIGTLGDPDEAADALQDAMVSAFRRAATFRGDSSVKTWLHRIVVNACLDRMRRRAARPASGGHDDALDTLAGSGRLSDPSGTTDTVLDVQAALRRLVPEQQAALVLVDMLGYPTAAAAEALGVPEGTVKSRAARGRARLLPRLAHLRPVRDRAVAEAADLTSTRRTRQAGGGRAASRWQTEEDMGNYSVGCSIPGGFDVDQLVMPREWAGGGPYTTKVGGVPSVTFCVPEKAGEQWNQYFSTASTIGGAFSILGFTGSAQTGYSHTATTEFHFYQAGHICGKNDYVGGTPGYDNAAN